MKVLFSEVPLYCISLFIVRDFLFMFFILCHKHWNNSLTCARYRNSRLIYCFLNSDKELLYIHISNLHGGISVKQLHLLLYKMSLITAPIRQTTSVNIRQNCLLKTYLRWPIYNHIVYACTCIKACLLSLIIINRTWVVLCYVTLVLRLFLVFRYTLSDFVMS